MSLKLTAIVDGASRGNPGDAAIGILVRDEEGKEIKRIARVIGKATNNVAEYTAFITCLEELKGYDVSELTVFTDSQLLARQLSGLYKVRDPKLKELFQKAQILIESVQFPVNIVNVPRTQTKEADQLANQALNLAGK
ncbi:MAG: ribonuclease HI family protein [Calditrichaeota bacterium]|nr:ribonuclease HI family protein [Calditrichota bacterium]